MRVQLPKRRITLTAYGICRILTRMVAELQLGSKVYVKEAVAGEPGVIVRLEDGAAIVEWADLPNGAHLTAHLVDELVPDESFLPGWPDQAAA